MTGLPKTTEFNRRIPKQKFYEKMEVSASLKKLFVEQIKLIYWTNKISPDTVNLAPGKEVTEIQVFELRLNTPEIEEALLRQIDREIPYHLLFLLEYEGKVCAYIGYKEATASGNKAFKVGSYYHTPWQNREDFALALEGLDLDAVYENFVRQIAGDRLQAQDPEESLKESVSRSEEKQALQKKIAALRTKIRKEKQLNKQMELNKELKKLKRQEENL